MTTGLMPRESVEFGLKLSPARRFPEVGRYTPAPMWRSRLISAALLALLGILGSPAIAQSIGVELLHFGAGDIARGGGPLAVQVEFKSSLDDRAEIEAVWEIPNADLDIVEYARRMVLAPGQAQRKWLYGVLPPDPEGTLLGAVYDLRLYEIKDGRRVRDLGTAKIAPANAANPARVLGLADDAILVVGPRAVGLDIYGQVSQGGTIPSMNEITAIANVRDAEAFPDRWDGLAAFDAIVWADGSISPARLPSDSGRALEQWIERGGNFVVALPAAGDPWAIGVAGRHRFSALLPSVAPTRLEDVALADILPILSLNPVLRDPKARIRMAVFDPATLDRGWRPFLATPARKQANAIASGARASEGQIVGIRRELGFGHMTVIGIDVDELSARSLQTPALPQGDVFWNRILGRRADTLSGAEYASLTDKSRLETSGGYSREIGDGRSVSETIGLSGQAAIGVLAATLVFGLYWLVAGPLGFAALKAAKKERWAWVAYVLVAGAFTVAIYAVGQSVAARDPQASHLTVLDVIEPPPDERDLTTVQLRRATSWISVFAPDYGSIEVAADPEGDPERRNLLMSWRPVGSAVEGFPSRERYTVPFDQSARAEVPSRATTIDFKSHWMGALREGWGSTPRIEQPIKVTIDAKPATPTIAISGTLTHGLRAPLRDVQVIHIYPRRTALQSLLPADSDGLVLRRLRAPLPAGGASASLSAWSPGETLDLARIFPDGRAMTPRALETTIEQRYYAALEQGARAAIGIAASDVPLELSLDMLTIYGMLHPPRYIREQNQTLGVLRITRTAGRELDLSDWFSQPCLLITGWLDGAELPYPLALDGERVPSSGRVLVRWMTPLPSDPLWVVPDKFPASGKP